jgi:hypothetical protein
VLSKEQRGDLANNITLFCDLYRAALQRTQATPKLHTLEAHFVEFMEGWHTLGIFGEDGMESLHAKLNVIFLRVHGIRNRVAKLKSAWGLLDQSQHGAALAVAAETRDKSKRKFTESLEDRKAKREKKHEEKKKLQQPQQPLLEQHQKKPKQDEQEKRKQVLLDKSVQRAEEQEKTKKTKKKKDQQQQQQQEPKAKAKAKKNNNKKAPAKKTQEPPTVAKPKKSTRKANYKKKR